ncbi:MAG: endonuclease V [bacterium]
MGERTGLWPMTAAELVARQHQLAVEAESALAADPWTPQEAPVVGGCFVAFARGEAGPGSAGDRAWAGAVSWNRGTVVASAVVRQRVPAPYEPGLLALREGPILAAAVAHLDVRPDVLLVDATGLDHPRHAGLALHLGAALGIPTVGVTHRPLRASGPLPAAFRRGARAPLVLDDVNGRLVAYWVCTRPGARPVVAHAAWRTTPETAAETVLAASTPASRTPHPLREARRVAREARAAAGH